MALNAMPPELQLKMVAIPPEQIDQALASYNQQEAGRLPGAMPNSQMRPGQSMPQAQLNSQNTIDQFMIAKPSLQLPSQLINGITQAQQMMLPQQIARNDNSNSLQQRLPSELYAINSRAMQQMDSTDIPPNIITHPLMPRNIPQELKTWGQVKNWVQHSSRGLPLDSLAIVTNLQRVHCNSIMRRRLNGSQGAPDVS
jgi:hypothetical protein